MSSIKNRDLHIAVLGWIVFFIILIITPFVFLVAYLLFKEGNYIISFMLLLFSIILCYIDVVAYLLAKKNKLCG